MRPSEVIKHWINGNECSFSNKAFSVIQIEEKKSEARNEIVDNSIESKRAVTLEIQDGEMSSTTEELIRDDGQNTL